MFGLFSSKKDQSNPLAESVTHSQGRLKVLEIQQLGGNPVTRSRLGLFIKTLSVDDRQTYNSCVKTYGEGTVKRFIMSDAIAPEERKANVIADLLTQGGIFADDILLQLSELKDGFNTYNKNLDAC